MDLLFQNIDEFADTQQLCELAPTLKKTVENTIDHQEIILGTQELIIPVTLDLKYATTTSYPCVIDAVKDNTAILQFTHATNPAKFTPLKQVEDILTDSSLFSCLAKLAPQYYNLHNDLASPYNNDIIYSPDVYFIKKNGRLARMPEWKKASVITAMIPDEVNEEVIYDRLCRMIDIALLKRHSNIVITTFSNASLDTIYTKLVEKYKDYFYSIDFIR